MQEACNNKCLMTLQPQNIENLQKRDMIFDKQSLYQTWFVQQEKRDATNYLFRIVKKLEWTILVYWHGGKWNICRQMFDDIATTEHWDSTHSIHFQKERDGIEISKAVTILLQ